MFIYFYHGNDIAVLTVIINLLFITANNLPCINLSSRPITKVKILAIP